jgi:urease subunit beta
MTPGEYVLRGEEIVGNWGRKAIDLIVSNTGDRPVQVGSHFHFFEVNKFLKFNRGKAFGMRLNIPAGTAIRFEPGDEKRVALVELRGKRAVYGLNGLVNGETGSEKSLKRAMKKAKERGFKGVKR